jgi:hypothetical protein
MPRIGVPEDVALIRKKISEALNTRDGNGLRVGDARFGVYAFFDYDGEPIYVGQSKERLRTRIRRHLTNQRTDAVAMNVLDPFEVAEIEMWPLWHLEDADSASEDLNDTEYTVFQQVLGASSFGAVLNEKDIAPANLTALPPSLRVRIIPETLYEARKHPDIRIARRASTIANLAKVISEREVSPGLRRTLVTQARRLERLSAQRFADFSDTPIPIEGKERGRDT